MRQPMRLALLTLLVLPGLLACGGAATPPPGGPAALAGTIRVSGAWALYPMMVRWAEEFQKVHPAVRVEVSAGGAGKGAADALAGLVEIGMISREIKQEEIDQGAVFVPVVKDAVFPAVSTGNPALEALLDKGLTRETFVALWIEGRAMTWGEVAGTGSPEPVNLYTRSDSCGAADTWARYLGGAQEDLQGIAVYGDPGLAEAVNQDPLGLGYNNLNYAYDSKTGLPVSGLAVVPIDVNGNGRVDPEERLDTKSQALAAVLSGVYPSPPARDLYLMTRDRFQGLALEFVRWILTDGQPYVDEAGYILLQDAQVQEALAKLRK
jgi:phosphate transport system substrate-binding protein